MAVNSRVKCTACGDIILQKLLAHPILDVPICEDCNTAYHTGSFTLDSDGYEMYCRWCGDGGELCSCDTCPKAFCRSCIQRNFGTAEELRIVGLADRWSCYVCSPEPVRDLIVKNGWQSFSRSPEQAGPRMRKILGRNLICEDISRGRERFPIPVFNEIDNVAAPTDFVYVTKPVSGGVNMTNNPMSLSCCTCTDNCQDSSKCECARLMDGFAYDDEKRLIVDKPGGVYECNQRCACHMARCKNRVVGNGPHLPLEIFRCPDSRKGWGVRCTKPVTPGTFIADYIGEVLSEEDAEARGLIRCDEYLFTHDTWGRTHACQHLCSLGLKTGLLSIRQEDDVDASTFTDATLREALGEALADILISKGSLAYARKKALVDSHGIAPIAKRLRSAQSVNFIDHASCESPAFASKSSIAKGNPSLSSGTTPASTDPLSWADKSKLRRLRAWREARSLFTDRAVEETTAVFDTLVIDARWFGGVGRFFNHSCSPNLSKITVFVETHDIRAPRIAFFANEYIPAMTEICYDYGYFEGNVDGKHRVCLCGAPECRKTLY